MGCVQYAEGQESVDTKLIFSACSNLQDVEADTKDCTKVAQNNVAWHALYQSYTEFPRRTRSKTGDWITELRCAE